VIKLIIFVIFRNTSSRCWICEHKAACDKKVDCCLCSCVYICKVSESYILNFIEIIKSSGINQMSELCQLQIAIHNTSQLTHSLTKCECFASFTPRATNYHHCQCSQIEYTFTIHTTDCLLHCKHTLMSVISYNLLHFTSPPSVRNPFTQITTRSPPTLYLPVTAAMRALRKTICGPVCTP
jgi:hypothetical protein